MKELILLKNNDVFTTSLVIAEGTGNQHNNFRKAVLCKEDKNQINISDLESHELEFQQVAEKYINKLIAGVGMKEEVKKMKKKKLIYNWDEIPTIFDINLACLITGFTSASLRTLA